METLPFQAYRSVLENCEVRHRCRCWIHSPELLRAWKNTSSKKLCWHGMGRLRESEATGLYSLLPEAAPCPKACHSPVPMLTGQCEPLTGLQRNVFFWGGNLEITHILWLTFSYVWRSWDAFVENQGDVLRGTFVVDPYLFQPGDEVSLSLLLLLKHTTPFCSHGLVWGASGQLGVARYQSCNNLHISYC